MGAFDHKLVIITGGALGIGRACARSGYMAPGARVGGAGAER